MLTVLPKSRATNTLLPQGNYPVKMLLWPRWDNPHDLILAFKHYAQLFAGRNDTLLVFYADPESDGPVEHCEQAIQRLKNVLTPNQTLNTHLIYQALTSTDVETLKAQITVTGILPSVMMAQRADLYETIEAPLLFSTQELRETLRVWDAKKRNMNLVWKPGDSSLPPETRLPLPRDTRASKTYLSERLARPMDAKRLAVIVPYRDRADHLSMLGTYLKDYLHHIPYDLFVIEQANSKPFNRAMLLNIGFDQVGAAYDYVALHDVDHFPIRTDYSYVEHPTHLAARVGPSYQLHYPKFMGGVTLINCEDFRAVNGFSNEFWGWGAEDDDFYLRLVRNGLSPHRRDGLYDTLPHPNNGFYHPTYEDNLERLRKMELQRVNTAEDGLSSLKYDLIKITRSATYYRIWVDI